MMNATFKVYFYNVYGYYSSGHVFSSVGHHQDTVERWEHGSFPKMSSDVAGNEPSDTHAGFKQVYLEEKANGKNDYSQSLTSIKFYRFQL